MSSIPKPFSAALIFAIALILTLSCNSTYTSKKKGYFKIDFPERQYREFNEPGVPYSFEYPVYATVVKDTTYFDSTPENPYWRNIDFPRFNARLFLSYKIIGGRATYKIKQADGSYKDSSGINYFDKMVNDAFNLTNKNESVASSIRDSLFTTKNNVTGIFFKVGETLLRPGNFLCLILPGIFYVERCILTRLQMPIH